MANQNPFHLWLGLPAEMTSPNYYQLLGVEPTERDRAVIEKAAKTRLKQLKAAKVGRHEEVLEKVQKRIRVAFATLKDPSKRAVYDQRLVAELTASPETRVSKTEADEVSSAANVPMALPVAASIDVDVDADVDAVVVVVGGGGQSSPTNKPAVPKGAVGDLQGLAIKPKKHLKRRRSPLIPAFIAILGIASLCGVVYIGLNYDRFTAYHDEDEGEGDSDGVVKADGSGAESSLPGGNDATLNVGVNGGRPSALNGGSVANDLFGRPTDLGSGEMNEATAQQPSAEIKPPAETGPETASKPESETGDESPEGVVVEKGELDFAELVQFRRHLQAAQTALYRRDRMRADNELENAANLFLRFADDPELEIEDDQLELSELVDSTMQVRDLLIGFWKQVLQSAEGISGGQEIEVDGAIAGFVEATPQFVTMRVGGTNTTYSYENLPPEWAMALAEQGAKGDLPTWRMQKAAFFAVYKAADPENIARAKAAAGDAVVDGHDPKAINQYVDFDLTRIGVPDKKIKFPGNDAIEEELEEMTIDSIDVRRRLRPEQAESAVDIMLDASLAVADPVRRVVRLQAAYLAARQSGDAYLLTDVLREMELWAELDFEVQWFEGLRRISRDIGKLDVVKKRSFVVCVLMYLDESSDQKSIKLLKKKAIKICEGEGFGELLREVESR